MARIVLLDPISDDGKNMLQNAPGIEFEEQVGLKGDDLKKCLSEFDGAICRSGVKITAESLEGNKRMKAIARAGVGVDNIDTAAATRAGIVVMNTPGGNTVSTAEQTFALMLALSRNVHPAYQALVEGRWDRKNFTGHQLAGKTLGIVGMGRIGQVVAGYAKAFEMRVIAMDPFFTPQKANELGIEFAEKFDDMLPQIDFLTVHTPLNEQTKGMFGKKELERIKKGAKLINCARGGIYDLDTLVEGMKSGRLGGVALDVYEEEPCTSHPLFGMKNVVCTPHLGASTEEAQTNVALEAVELLVDYFTNGTIRQAVNFGTLDAKTLAGLRGFLNVAYRLGVLAAQLDLGTTKGLKMVYRGEVAKKDTSLVSNSFVAGLMSTALVSDVNIISAAGMLKDRGIEFSEDKSTETVDLSSLITAELVGEKSSVTIAGTIFGNSMPRLVMMNGFRLEGFLDGNLCVIDHHDKPGVIGLIGTTCGKLNINISAMSVGQTLHSRGGDSIAVFSIDQDLTEKMVAELTALDAVKKTWFAKLPPQHWHPAWMG